MNKRPFLLILAVSCSLLGTEPMISNEQHILDPKENINQTISSALNSTLAKTTTFISNVFYFAGVFVVGNTILYNTLGKNSIVAMEDSFKPYDIIDPAKNTTCLADIQGSLPETLDRILIFIKKPELFAAVGAKLPKGIVLYGAPGTGKTLIAKAIAHETDAVCIVVHPASFTQAFQGSGPMSVKNLFKDARSQNKKVIIFLDELDSLGSRKCPLDNNGEQRNVMNQLLTELDGFTKDNHIFVIGATNRLEDIDEALLRPGRFGHHIEIPLPNDDSRNKILKHHLHSIKHAIKPDVIAKIVEDSKDYSGADLANLANECAIIAAMKNKACVEDDDLTAAFQSIKKQRSSNTTKPQLPTIFDKP